MFTQVFPKSGGTLVKEFVGTYNGTPINIAQKFPNVDLTNVTSSNFSYTVNAANIRMGARRSSYYGQGQVTTTTAQIDYLNADFGVPSISYNPNNKTLSANNGSLTASTSSTAQLNGVSVVSEDSGTQSSGVTINIYFTYIK